MIVVLLLNIAPRLTDVRTEQIIAVHTDSFTPSKEPGTNWLRG
jgi:hypothetical protein